VLNRNAMNNRISDDMTGKKKIVRPFGIFFVDVNGLKSVNDTKGHLAGDNLLKDVASTLMEVECENKEVYRVGGDEFMIIAENATAEDALKINEELFKKSEREGRAHYAVGLCHSEEAADVIKAMQKADERMYEVKADYYSRHPEYEWQRKSR
ncbi:MAG: GGDEF domain-containing protein, partial [Lachnospiraceae bacterium]|nr:GGDEF domain-containing protein [Lachnospiraceae bacterium]